MKTIQPLIHFYLFAGLLLLSAAVPLAYFYIYLFAFLCCVLIFRVRLHRFFKKIFLYLIAGHLSVFLLFFLNEILFGIAVSLNEQAIIVSNLYFRTASAIAAILFYRQINTYRDTLFMLIRHRFPVRMIQILMIAFRLFQVFYSELRVFAQHFRLRIYRVGRWRYAGVMVKKLFIHFYQQAETVAHYHCLKNLDENPAILRRLFHD